MSAKFGPAGNSESFSNIHKSSLAAPKWIAEFGLDCYEYQCGKGVHVGEETCRKLGENARAAGISLSLHAPYFINLANPDPEAVQKTIGYVTAACQAAAWMGAERVVIHSGALMKRSRREAQEIALKTLPQVIRACDGQGFAHIALCPETMGKINQLGDLDEVLELCTLDERLLPCIDFGHLYAAPWGRTTARRFLSGCWTGWRRCWAQTGPAASTALLPHRVHPQGGREVPPHLRRRRGLRARLDAPGPRDRPAELVAYVHLRKRGDPGGGCAGDEENLSRIFTGVVTGRFRRGPHRRWGGAFAPYKHFCEAKILAQAELISAEH